MVADPATSQFIEIGLPMSESKPLKNPWLSPNDDANHPRNGFWVPSPDEIESISKEIKEDNLNLMLRMYVRNDNLLVRPPEVIDTSDMPDGYLRKSIEEPQLCDCPYWGTEFENLP